MTQPPYAGRGKVAVLFLDGGDTEPSQCARKAFDSIEWPKECSTEVVDVRTDRSTAAWFGIVTFPAVAIVSDGILLSIEHECDAEACERALSAAAPRARRVECGV